MEKTISTLSYEKLIQDYISKQKRFKSLVKQIKNSIDNCEFKKYGCSLNDYVKKKWNISRAQTYRFLIAARVMDELEEFEFQPTYVNLCKSLDNCAKTSEQLKLLWKILLKRAKGKPYYINSSHVSKTWKEICNDKKYFDICHYEDKIFKKFENSSLNPSKSNNRNEKNENLILKDNISNLSNNFNETFPLSEASNIFPYTTQTKTLHISSTKSTNDIPITSTQGIIIPNSTTNSMPLLTTQSISLPASNNNISISTDQIISYPVSTTTTTSIPVSTTQTITTQNITLPISTSTRVSSSTMKTIDLASSSTPFIPLLPVDSSAPSTISLPPSNPMITTSNIPSSFPTLNERNVSNINQNIQNQNIQNQNIQNQNIQNQNIQNQNIQNQITTTDKPIITLLYTQAPIKNTIYQPYQIF